jgi:hypothetical protein
MTISGVSGSLVVMVALVAAALAGSTIWLLLTDPMTIATAVDEGSVASIAGILAEAAATAFWGLLAWIA